MPREVVVVGAGVGGLSCALRLAVAGHRVRVLERASTVGGALDWLERHTAHGRFGFDTGPGLLTLPQVFADLFAAAGSTLEKELDLVRLDPIARHIFADNSRLDSTSDTQAFVGQIAATLGEPAAADWRRLWRRAERIWDSSWQHVLCSPIRARSLARLAWRLPELAAIGPLSTVRGLGQAYLRDPKLVMLLDRYATYAGSDPRRAPAALIAAAYAELTFGGWYPRGGLVTLGAALRRAAEGHGVRIETGTEVSRVEGAGGRVHGVRLVGGGRVAADVVVVNADAAALYRDLFPHPRHLGRSSRRSLAGFVLLLGIRGHTPWLAHHTVFFPIRYDGEFDAIFDRPARPAPEPTVLVTVPDDPALCPDGGEAWFVLVNAPPHGSPPSAVDWKAPGLAEGYAEHIMAVLAARGIDVRERVLFREIRTPADLAERTGAPGGSIYGTPRHGPAGLLRPPNVGPVRGLYLVGGSTHPGGGLPMVCLSGQIVAGLIGPA